MIDVHFWPTPNGHKITIALEELGLPYRIVPVDIGRGEQFTPEFQAISPNGRMPAIVDHEPTGGGEPLSIFESAAILQYLAEKGGGLMPKDARGKYRVLEWLSWQVAGLGPMTGQYGHFNVYAKEKIPYAIDRYKNEVRRLHAVMETQLGKHPFLAGEYSIADAAAYPWVAFYVENELTADRPNLRRWCATIAARPAVVRAYAKGSEVKGRPMDEQARKHLFDKKY
ncbi:MAG: glutathione S-transferase N-terminal domain-containing protein [Sandaracinus sp.]